jgi:hypothetical protein
LNRAAVGWLGLVAIVAARCSHRPSPEVLRPIERPERFTCCNLRYDATGAISDANYWWGTTLPAGTPVRIERLTDDAVTFSAEEVTLTLTHEHGTKEESFQQYLDKVLVSDDPRVRIARYPRSVRRAISSAKVERGMTRDQVLRSLGYPPTDETPSLEDREWKYWWNSSYSYTVVFNAAGKVAEVVGRPAPTAELPIRNADRPPSTKPPKRRGR